MDMARIIMNEKYINENCSSESLNFIESVDLLRHGRIVTSRMVFPNFINGYISKQAK